jgi:catechol 2,3-dioxygenase-like lactoylglutathione lyase family enzyme
MRKIASFRGPTTVLLTLILLCVLAASPAWTQARVDSVGITVSDLERSIAFYSEVLSFELLSEWEVAGTEYEHALGVFGTRLRVARMRLGGEEVELMQFLAPRGRPMMPDSSSNDAWFQHIAIIVSDMDRAYARLRQHNVEHASSGPQTLPDWNPSAGGISAFYFRDPDGNHLEILHFPSDKGESRWHASGPLFLGIDHTAIVVTDTRASLRFYADLLGLSVVGHSENYGIEQERLNNVFGARLDITALRARDGIGVELLEYLAPRTGRPIPADTRANDLWHWQINFIEDDLEALDACVRRTGYRYVSSGLVELTQISGEDRAGLFLMVRDPDGHASSFLQPRHFSSRK